MNNFIIEYKYEASKMMMQFDGFNNSKWNVKMKGTPAYKMFLLKVKSSKFVKLIKLN